MPTSSNGDAIPLVDRPILAATLLLALAGLILHISGWLRQSPGLAYTGTIINVGDASVYLAAMRQGAAGNWLFDIQFTPEVVPPRFQYFFYLLLGKAAAALPGSEMVWWHGARVASTVVALGALWWSIATLWPASRPARRVAWLLIVAAAGFGWLARLAGMPLHELPDLSMSEWTVFLTLLNPAHYALGLALTVGAIAVAAQLIAAGASRRRVLAGWLLALLLGVIYPYAVPLVAAVLGAGWLVTYRRQPRPWRNALALALMTTPWLPLAAYYGWFLRRDPYWWQTHIVGNSVPPPTGAGLLIGLGLPGILALLGLRTWLRQGRSPFVPAWLGVQLLLLYAPVPYSGRFALALMVPLGLLGANWLTTHIMARPAMLAGLILLLLAPSTLFLSGRLLRNISRSTGWAYFVPEGEVAAARWLGAHSRPEDVILVYHQMGNLLPRYAPGRVFIGQSFLTAEVHEKARLVNGFWHEDAPDGWREALLDRWRVNWIYAGSFEEALTVGSVDVPGNLVYDAGGVRIFAVTPETQ